MSVETGTDVGRNRDTVRFIKIRREVINLDTIAYVTISQKTGDGIIALNVNGFDGKPKSVIVPKQKVAELLVYLESLTVLDIQWEAKE